MKSERRHELLQNTLDAEIARLRVFFQKYGSKISWGLLLAAVVVLAGVLWHRRLEQRKAQVQYQFEQVLRLSVLPDVNRQEILERLRTLSQQDDVPWVAASASLAMGRWNAMEAVVAPTSEARAAALEAARADYQRVLDTFDDRPVIVAGAQIGLGKIAEAEGKYDDARRYYQAVLDMPNLEGYPVRNMAQESLNQLAAMESPVRLATTQPAWMETPNQTDREKTTGSPSPVPEG